MKTKSKLFVGLGLLFGMITLLTFLSTFFINKLSEESKNILIANYNSIDYCREMINALNDGNNAIVNEENFNTYLSLQLKNITEPVEATLTQQLSQNFQSYKTDTSAIATLHRNITDIMLVNMQAIVAKDSIAQKTALKAVLWIGFTGTICFLFALLVLFNLPGNIANPIKELTQSIKQIASGNYKQRIHFDKQNEFGDLSIAFNSMAEKLEEYRAGSLEKLMMEKKRIDTLINNMHDPVIGIDETEKIIFMNDIALKITGLRAENVLGKLVQKVSANNDLLRRLTEELVVVTPANAGPLNTAMKIYADDKESYFEQEIVPIKIIPTGEEVEKLIGTVILLRNVTTYKELDFAKTNFIATVSHELKTPIASIKMSLQLLENEKLGVLNAEQQSLVESVKEDSNRLLKITSELLNMTQLETGTIQMNVMPCDAKEIVEYAVSTNRAAADQKNISVKIKYPEEIPTVLADNEKTSWVLTNLLSNAIRYSYENSTVVIELTTADGMERFAVIDGGQGISPQYLDKIFDRYYRIPGSKKEGTGLGLSISKEFIEGQGGFLTVESDFGKGSTFSFTLKQL